MVFQLLHDLDNSHEAKQLGALFILSERSKTCFPEEVAAAMY
jgi:hypothetical protein